VDSSISSIPGEQRPKSSSYPIFKSQRLSRHSIASCIATARPSMRMKQSRSSSRSAAARA
jgi:hypothetical protein